MSTTDQNTAARMHRIAVDTRAAVLTRYRPDSCIESTRAIAEVYRYFGHRLVPVATRVAFYTAEAYATNAARGWAVGVTGTGEITNGGWDGHLVGLVDDAWLVDGSADQFDRPAKGLHVGGPVVVATDRAQLDNGLSLADDASGLVAVYRTIDNTSWRRAPAWTRNTAVMRTVVGEAIRQVGKRPVTV